MHKWIGLVALLVACNDGPTGDTDDSVDDTDSGTIVYDLAFDGTGFSGAHAGQPFDMAVVECSTTECDPETATGTVVDRASGMVPSTTEWAVEFLDVLIAGEVYELHLWIDSNFGGGSAGACDSPDIDHQWAFEAGTASTDLTVDAAHDPNTTSPVCGSFDESDTDAGGGGGGGGGGYGY